MKRKTVLLLLALLTAIESAAYPLQTAGSAKNPTQIQEASIPDEIRNGKFFDDRDPCLPRNRSIFNDS